MPPPRRSPAAETPPPAYDEVFPQLRTHEKCVIVATAVNVFLFLAMGLCLLFTSSSPSLIQALTTIDEFVKVDLPLILSVPQMPGKYVPADKNLPWINSNDFFEWCPNATSPYLTCVLTQHKQRGGE